MKRGITTVAICLLCRASAETSAYLFLECSFVQQVWNWFYSTISYPIDLFSIHSIILVCSRGWSPQAKDAILAAITKIFWFI